MATEKENTNIEIHTCNTYICQYEISETRVPRAWIDSVRFLSYVKQALRECGSNVFQYPDCICASDVYEDSMDKQENDLILNQF